MKTLADFKFSELKSHNVTVVWTKKGRLLCRKEGKKERRKEGKKERVSGSIEQQLTTLLSQKKPNNVLKKTTHQAKKLFKNADIRRVVNSSLNELEKIEKIQHIISNTPSLSLSSVESKFPKVKFGDRLKKIIKNNFLTGNSKLKLVVISLLVFQLSVGQLSCTDTGDFVDNDYQAQFSQSEEYEEIYLNLTDEEMERTELFSEVAEDLFLDANLRELFVSDQAEFWREKGLNPDEFKLAETSHEYLVLKTLVDPEARVYIDKGDVRGYMKYLNKIGLSFDAGDDRAVFAFPVVAVMVFFVATVAVAAYNFGAAANAAAAANAYLYLNVETVSEVAGPIVNGNYQLNANDSENSMQLEEYLLELQRLYDDGLSILITSDREKRVSLAKNLYRELKETIIK